MSSICVSRKIIGTKKNLIIDDDGFFWSEFVPNNSYYFSGEVKYLNDFCFDSLLLLKDLNINFSVPEKYITASKEVNNEFPLWKYILPSDTFRTSLEKLINDLKGNLDNLPKDYFRGTWASGNAILRQLQPAYVDITIFDQYKASQYNLGSLNSFTHDKDGLCQNTIYDRFGTVTGRLSIKSGPNIHNLKKDLRNILTSRYKNGRIINIDFSSLEPSLIMREFNEDFSGDVYSSLSEKLSISRKVIKAAIIIELYGGSKKTLIEKFSLSKEDVDQIYNHIYEKFRLRDLKKLLISNIKNGFMFNKFGRPIFLEENPDRIILNYYAQSTGADISLLGYKTILEELNNTLIVPLFVLHDGIFLDVPYDCIERVLNISSVKVDKYKMPFLVSSRINE